MNKDMYRLVWNSGMGALQVVSEVAKSKTCGGSVTSSGPGKRTSSKRGIAAWPLALLTLGMASSALAASYSVTNDADAGAGSLRQALSVGGIVDIDPAVKSILLSSDIAGYSGPIVINASDALSITGGSLIGNDFSLSLNGASAQKTLNTTISGEFSGGVAIAPGGSVSGGAAGGTGSTLTSSGGVGGAGGNGEDGLYTAPGSGSAAITGSNFKITNEADVYGGQGIASIAPKAGGAGGLGGGLGGYSGTGGAGGSGGAGASGGVGSAGGAGISAAHFSVVNNALVQGGNGAAGVVGGNGGQGGLGGSAPNLQGKYGGNGGRGGNAGDGGNGGAGGAGISGMNMEIVNTGTIQGGNGGSAGAAGVAGAGGAGGVGYNSTSTAGEVGNSGQAGAAGLGGVGIVATGSSVIRNSGTISGGFAYGAGGARANAIELSGSGNTLVLQAGSVINGNVVSQAGSTDTLALGGIIDSTFDLNELGNLGDPQQYQGFDNFQKEDSSTWTLTGVDTYGKDWAVNAGTLVLDDAAELWGGVSIKKDATLATGEDAYIGGVLNNAGTLSIGSTGSPFATLVTDSDYTQSSTGTLRISALSTSEFSKLDVDGNVKLDGKLDIDVKSGNTLAIGNKLQGVITAGGTVSGKFSSVTDNSSLFKFTPTYNGSSVDLKLVADNGSDGFTLSGSAQALGNSQARGAAAVLDGVIASNPTGRLASYFIPLSGTEEISRAASEVLPMTGGSTQAARTALTSINGVVQGRSQSVRGVSSGDAAFTDQHLWIKPFGSWADQESHGGVAGMSSNVGGIAFGLDGSLNDRWLLGTAFVYANADTRNSGSSARQSLKTDVYQLVGYGTYHLDDNLDLNFQIDAGQNRNEGKRDIDFAKLKAKSDYDSWTAHAGVSLDRTFSLSTQTRFTPSVRADYTWIKDEAYKESGAEDLNLHAKSRTTDQFILGVDGKLSHDLTEQVNLSGNLGVGYDFLADKDSITSSFAGAPGAAFTTYGGDAQRWLVRGGTEVSYKVNGQVELAVRYDLEKRSNFLNQTASAEARWAF